MADFMDFEAEESENEEELDFMEKKRAKKSRAVVESDEEEDDDGEEVKDLIDDNPIEDESDGEDSDGSDGSKKRKKRDDEDFDDRLEDDDYDLLEENLGIAVERNHRFKRLKRPLDDDEELPLGEERDAIANQIFEGGSGDEDERQSVRSHRRDVETLVDDESDGEESDVDDFIVDDDGNPIATKKPKRKARFADAALQEAQDIFGVDFDYGEFGAYDEAGEGDPEDEDDEEQDEYAEEDETGERVRRPKKTPKKRATRRTIFEIYEPSELKRGHFTDIDNEIRSADIPERMQLRSVPVTSVPEGSDELDLEAEWIYNRAFCKPTITIQDAHLSDEAKERARKGPQTVGKIKNALDFMRNQHFEVPFISFYRKEYVLPELNINDLWKVYKYDGKWCLLRQRKEALLNLFETMRDYQLDEIMKNPNAPIPDDVRVIKDEDIERIKNIETNEELNDVHRHFMLYYSHNLPNMQEASRRKDREKKLQARLLKRKQRIAQAEENGEEPPAEDEIEIEEDQEPDEILKQAVRTGPYAICRKAGLDGFAKKFGLSPEHFGENLRDNYQRHEVEQDPIEPSTVALDYLGGKFTSADEVTKAVQLMVAYQLAREPLVRKCVREIYMERAKLTVRPTQIGIKIIDENHAMYTIKYLKDKPVRDLVGDQWLKLTLAEEEKLITISLSDSIEGDTTDNYVNEIKQLYYRDEFSKNVQDWNALRVGSVEIALNRIVIPELKKELRANLMTEAKEFVMRASCRKMYNWIKDAPYVASPEFDEDEDEEWGTKKGIRVMGLAYVPDLSQAAFACVIAPDGECTDYLRLPHLLKRKNGFRQDEKILKAADMLALRNFIATKKPHVIAVGGESREAVMAAEDLRECITSLTEEEDLPPVKVEICDNELAKLYANSNKGIADFRDYPVVLREAISLARRLQDPLVEFTQLCTPDEEIMCLKYHTYQDQLPKEELLENLYLEFVNRVNEVGVDFNRAVQQSYFENLVQFVCGLGPRKGQTLIKMLKQTNQRLENRTQLVTACHMGPKVFINCAGFVKIDTNSLGDSTEAYVEVLDGSRVHPETYEWARKMAVDALEYDDEEANPAGALEEILESPERLKDLDLDAFAEELERQGFGNKCVTLYDIRAELNSRYKDLRAPYQSLSPEKLFDVLTKETPETFYIGKLTLATVSGINHRKPQGDQLDQANPVRNEDTGLWQCPFCLQSDFPELCEVWNHFDAGGCPGKATGVKLRLDNGISGYIHIKNVSDKRVENLNERVYPGQTIHCRIIKIEVERFSVECTSKSSDLLDVNHQMRPQRDPYYDTDAEVKDSKVKEDAKKIQQRQTYVKRVIVHPSFHNITYSEAEKLMKSMKQGEAIVRPSSKGENHLTVTWKVTDEILHHIDVTEEEKVNSFSLGKSLMIGNEKFEDLDEIIARHVNPMGLFASELLDYKHYRSNVDGCKDKANALLKELKKKQPSGIPYIISASKSRPAKFLLSYLPRVECKHEYVSVSPDGLGYRGRNFTRVEDLFRWFKKHFRDPIPVHCTPRSTPGTTDGVSHETIKRVAKNLPSHMLQSLSQAANQTPRHYPPLTPGSVIAAGYGATHTYPNTPYTPSGQTPYMTPYQTPHHTPHHAQLTPRYGQQHISAQHDGQFLLPAPPPPTGIHYRSTQSHRPAPPAPVSVGGLTDLSKAAAAWAQLSASQTTPKISSNTPRYDDPRKTPRDYDNPSSRDKQRSKLSSGRTPSQRSPRESPRNNSSRISGNGDQTPLWDESESWD